MTTAPQLPGSFPTETLAGQLIVGGCASWTETVNEQVVDPAVQVTLVEPMGKNEPDDGEQLTLPQVPVGVADG